MAKGVPNLAQNLTSVGWSRRRVGPVGAVRTIRRVEAQVVGLGVVWHRARGAAVVLVRTELAKWRAGAVPRLLAVVEAAVRRRGHGQGRGLLRLVQAVVTVRGNLVRMHISVQVLKNPRHLGAEQPGNLYARKPPKKHDSDLSELFVNQNASPARTEVKMSGRCVPPTQWPVIICHGRRWERIYVSVSAAVSEATNG